MFTAAAEALNNSGDRAGRVRYTNTVYKQDGVSLRLEAEAEYNEKIVEDTEKVATLRANYNQLIEADKADAANRGITYEELLEEKKEAKKQEFIAAIMETGTNEEDAVTQAEEYFKQSDREIELLKEQDENFDEEEFKFRRWVMEQGEDPTKKIYVVVGGTPLHLVYSFDEEITGVPGFNTVAIEEAGKVEEETTFDSDGIKKGFAAYISSEGFAKGLRFINRIAEDEISVSVE